MSHSPSRYTLLGTAAEIEAAVGPFENGDQAVVIGTISGYSRTYTYGSKAVVGNGLTILASPGGTGWYLDGGRGTYLMKFRFVAGTLEWSKSSDDSLDDTTITIVKNAVGNYSLTFNTGSVIRPGVGPAKLSYLSATPNANAHAAASAVESAANVVTIHTTNIGLDGAASSALDCDVTLAVCVA